MPMLTFQSASLLLFSDGSYPLAVPAHRVVSIIEPVTYWPAPRLRKGGMGFFRFQEKLIPLLRMTDLLDSPAGEVNYFVVVESVEKVSAIAVQSIDNLIRLNADCFEHPRDREMPFPRRLVQAIAREQGQEDDIFVMSVPAITGWLGQETSTGR